MTTTFYASPEHRSGNAITLPEEEARHAARVLRHQVGDVIQVVDGVGGLHRVVIREITKKTVSGEILESVQNQNEPELDLTIGLGLLKNPARFETFAEKAVELGVRRIVPLVTERTERTSVKEERLHKILVAAMKQSGRTRLPELYPATHLEEMLTGFRNHLRVMCHESAPADQSLANILNKNDLSETVIIIGPEGGFSESEIAMSKRYDWHIASLGARRLRAETAAIAVAAFTMLIKDW